VLVGEKREIGAQRMSERRQVLRPSLQRSRARNSVNALPAPSAQRASDDHPSIDALPLTTRGAIRRWGTWLQLCVGVDMPHSAKVIYRPGTPGVDMERVYSIGVRLIFDWRRYFW